MNNIKSNLLIESLESLGFAPLEVKIYLALLESGKMSVYQLAKKIEMSRPSIYNAIEHMVNKGLVLYVPEKTPFYIAKEPDLLLEKIEKETRESLANAKNILKEYENSRVNEEVLAIKGYDDIIIKAKEIIKSASNDIYINSDFDLDVFKDEFEEAGKRGIKIIVFSFLDINRGADNVELFSHMRKINSDHNASRFMLVEDKTISIVAGKNSEFDDWSGLISNNPLTIKIISEHIHNDIYMLKFRDLYGRKIYEDIHINSQFENNMRGV